MECIEELKILTRSMAVSGHEKQLSLILKDMFEKYCDSVDIDKFYNVAGVKYGAGINKKKIMVTAHMDEIGFIVKSIDKNGFLKVASIGGIDGKILLAQEVIVHGKKDLIGIIGAKPPHLLKPEEYKKSVKLEDLAVDIGMSREKVLEYISIGDVVTFKPSFSTLGSNRVSSKSLDNRCGVAVLLETMRELGTLNFQHDVYFIATTQEEFNYAGAITAAYKLEPDAAVVIDVCHGDMPDAPKDDTYPLGKGPAVAIGPNLHKKLTKRVMDTARDENIPFQTDTEPGNTGTEAWAVQISRCGTPTILISIPLRYMHTAVETVQISDLKNTARLTARFIAKTGSEMEELLCY